MLSLDDIKVKVLVAQLCWTLYDPLDWGGGRSSVHGIVQVRILEWVAIPFSRGSSWPRDRTWVLHVSGRFFTICATRSMGTKTMTTLVIFVSQHLSPMLVHHKPSTAICWIDKKKLADYPVFRSVLCLLFKKHLCLLSYRLGTGCRVTTGTACLSFLKFVLPRLMKPPRSHLNEQSSGFYY